MKISVRSNSISLTPSDEADSVCVDDIFKDQEMAENLYMEIMFQTYGKKKLMSSISHGLKSLRSTS